MRKTLGIIGGGQLGMMLTEAAKKNLEEYIEKVIVLDPAKDCPAALVGAQQIVGDFKDRDAILELAEKSDIITYEIESGDSKILESVQQKAVINPSPKTLQTIQDKLFQKSFLRKNGISVADFIETSNDDKNIDKAIKDFGFPVLLKARRDAYDGRGNYVIHKKDDIAKAFQYFKSKPVMLEKFVHFKMEISVIAARNTLGSICTYPVVENIHEDNILKITVAPARISKELAKRAQDMAFKTMSVLKGAGVFGIEMFVTSNDDILVNEIAPRVHNSGHHTLQSSNTSQFEQHLRAILGLELKSVELRYPTVMYNLLGPKEFTGKYKVSNVNESDVYLKMYGKKESRPKRKMGHFNLVGKDSHETIESLLERVNKIKDKIKIIPINN